MSAAVLKSEIEEKVKDLRKQLLQLRFDKAMGKLQNPVQITQVKREIARNLTKLSMSRT